MKIWKTIYLAAFTLPFVSGAADQTASIPPTPKFKIEETLVSYHGTGTMDYLAFPAILPTGDKEILLSYKRGRSHARDTDSVLEIIRVNLDTGRIVQDPIHLKLPDEIMQMGEWIRFPDGSLGTYIDAQIVDEEMHHERTGLAYAISRDNGKSFGPIQRVGVVDGVEYGYLFDEATIGKRVYALIMTFEYLAGGRRSVDALYTDDNGKSWHFINNLSEEFGDIRINESSLIPYKNGFLVATRGYDNMQRLHQVDKNFKVIHEVNITEETESIGSYIGRPRLFTHENDYFLIGRNWRQVDRSIPMELGLIRFDPETLKVDKHYVIDNVEQGKVTDGYYPCPILVKSGKQTILNVFDYRAILGNSPDIIRFQFNSAEFLK